MPRKASDDSAASRIRYYIYGLIRQNSSTSVRVPSSYELAELFGTTRRIAQCELERLVADGVLIGKHRVGTFTNPQASYALILSSYRPMPLIGVTFGMGDFFLYAASEAMTIAGLYRELAGNNCYVHDLRLISRNPEQRLRELAALKLDGIVWAGMSAGNVPDDAFFDRLAGLEIPVVTLGVATTPSLSGVAFDLAPAARELARIFRREGLTRFAAVCMRERQAFIDAFLGEFPGEKPEFSLLPDASVRERREATEAILTGPRPPEVLFCGESGLVLWADEIARRQGGRTRVAALWPLTEGVSFRGYQLRPSFDEEAKLAVATLLEQIRGGKREVKHHFIENELIYRN